MQRGDERVHLERLGVGNNVMVQAALVPSDLDDSSASARCRSCGRGTEWGDRGGAARNAPGIE
jgi:hypothetical protein